MRITKLTSIALALGLVLGGAAAACGGSSTTTGSIVDADGGGSTDEGGTATGEGGTGGKVDEAGVETTNNDYGTASVCTSGKKWTFGTAGSSSMEPGRACIDCHSMENAPTFAVAGTVYPTAHEPNDCNGKAAVQVILTDAKGQVFTLTANTAGNFACGSRARSGFQACAGFTPPYNAKVVSNGVVRHMVGAQTSGDCNSCHTETGTMSAPGRIMAP
jgi:hypothetical protein